MKDNLPEKINIGGLQISNTNYEQLTSVIFNCISDNRNICIAYANANSFNIAANSDSFRVILNSFDVIHPDGIGIYIASKLLHGSGALLSRFNGSDFYPQFMDAITEYNYRIFLFGEDLSTLEKAVALHPSVICGYHSGYDFKPDEVIKAVNDSYSHILLIGLPTPLQEEFVYHYRDKLKVNILLCVGEGIKVLAGTKIRGPLIFRKLGLEWFTRFLTKPVKYFRRYIIGNPVFLYRIIKLKLAKFER